MKYEGFRPIRPQPAPAPPAGSARPAHPPGWEFMTVGTPAKIQETHAVRNALADCVAAGGIKFGKYTCRADAPLESIADCVCPSLSCLPMMPEPGAPAHIAVRIETDPPVLLYARPTDSTGPAGTSALPKLVGCSAVRLSPRPGSAAGERV